MNQLVRVSAELQRNFLTAQDDIAHLGLAVTEVQSNHNGSSEVLYDKISQVEERLNQTSAANSVVFDDLVSHINTYANNLTEQWKKISGLHNRIADVMKQFHYLSLSHLDTENRLTMLNQSIKQSKFNFYLTFSTGAPS